MPQLIRTLLWQRLDSPGAEYFGLWRLDSGWELRGTVLTSFGGTPARLRYGVACDVQWITRAIHIGLRTSGPEQALHVTVGEDNQWSTRGAPLETLSGARDAILHITPGTCTLPIRRLDLDVGAHAELQMALIAFPVLKVSPRASRLERVAESRYLLKFLEDGTAWEIEVDDLGLVTKVAGMWSCVACSD